MPLTFTGSAYSNNSGNSPPGSVPWIGTGPYTALVQVLAADPPAGKTNWLEVTDFVVSPQYMPTVPSDAINVQLHVRISRRSNAVATLTDAGVYLLDSVGASIDGDQSSVSAWPGSYGNADYVFDSTPATVNAADFTLRLGAQATGSEGDFGQPDVQSVLLWATWEKPFTDGSGPTGSEDGYGTDGATFDNSATSSRTGKTGGAKYAAFSLFSNLTKDPGDTVAHAYLWAYDRGGAAIDVKIGVKNSVSPSAPASAAACWTDVNSNLTATQVDWSISSSSPSTPYPIIQSPDLAAILTEYFAIGGFSSGASDLLIYVYGLAGTTDVHDFGTSEGVEAMFLTVEFTSGLVVTLATGTVYQMLIAGGL